MNEPISPYVLTNENSAQLSDAAGRELLDWRQLLLPLAEKIDLILRLNCRNMPQSGSVYELTAIDTGCWTDFYTLGVLEANLDANTLNANSWTQINHPLLSLLLVTADVDVVVVGELVRQ